MGWTRSRDHTAEPTESFYGIQQQSQRHWVCIYFFGLPRVLVCRDQPGSLLYDYWRARTL